MDNKIVNLFEGDQRAAALVGRLSEIIYQDGLGLPVPTILGAIEIIRFQVITNAAGKL